MRGRCASGKRRGCRASADGNHRLGGSDLLAWPSARRGWASSTSGSGPHSTACPSSSLPQTTRPTTRSSAAGAPRSVCAWLCEQCVCVLLLLCVCGCRVPPAVSRCARARACGAEGWSRTPRVVRPTWLQWSILRLACRPQLLGMCEGPPRGRSGLHNVHPGASPRAARSCGAPPQPFQWHTKPQPFQWHTKPPPPSVCS